MAELSFNRLMTDGTFVLDTTTVGKLKGDLSAVVGKAVTITGNCEVGYGTTGKPLEGIVLKAEYTDQGKTEVVVTVAWQGTFEDIPATGVVAGDQVTVDGAGGLAKLETGTGRASVIGFNTDKATIKMC